MEAEYEEILQKTSELDLKAFLISLPAMGYVKVEVTKVIDAKTHEEIDEVEKYQKMINDVLNPKVEEDIYTKFEKEKKRNDELERKFAELEAKLNPKSGVKEAKSVELSDDEVKIAWEQKFGKKPHHKTSIETLKDQLK